jgi:cytochrome c peroxidase
MRHARHDVRSGTHAAHRLPDASRPGDISHFDSPNLRGISRTAPYFHNNTAATLEEVVEHYKQFYKRVAIQAPQAPLLTTQPGSLRPSSIVRSPMPRFRRSLPICASSDRTTASPAT